MDQNEKENNTCRSQQSFITVPKGRWLETSDKLSSQKIFICGRMVLNPYFLSNIET